MFLLFVITSQSSSSDIDFSIYLFTKIIISKHFSMNLQIPLNLF